MKIQKLMLFCYFMLFVASLFANLNVAHAQFPQSPVNGLWHEIQDIDTEAERTLFTSRVLNGKINQVYCSIAHWVANNVLEYQWSDSTILDYITYIKSVNPEIKVFAWVWCDYLERWGSKKPNVTTSTQRDNLINQVVACANKGFDGIQEDTEGWYGSNANFIDYTNGVASTLSSIGKLCFVYNPDNHLQYITADYLPFRCWMYGYNYMKDFFAYYDPKVTTPYLMKVTYYNSFLLFTGINHGPNQIGTHGLIGKQKILYHLLHLHQALLPLQLPLFLLNLQFLQALQQVLNREA